MAIAILGVMMRLFRERRWHREYDFCAYLTVAALFSVTGYVAGRCGQVGFGTVRYDLLSLIGVVGLSAWWLRVNASRIMARIWISLFAAWIAVAAVADVGLLSEYLRRPPIGAKQLIVRSLEAQGIHYATADYWDAYAVTFMTNEAVIVHSNDFMRIPQYRDIVAAHADEAVRISRTSCPGGRPIATGLFFCPQ